MYRLLYAHKKLLEYCLKYEKSFHTFLDKSHQYFLRFKFIKNSLMVILFLKILPPKTCKNNKMQ